MSDIQHFRPDIDVTLDYWCNSAPFQANWQKTKLVVSHPTLPIILCCDEEQNLSLWNYSLRQLEWSRTSQQLIKDATGVSPISILHPVQFNPRRISHKSVRRSQGIPTTINHESFPSNINSAPVSKGKDNTFGEIKSIDFCDSDSVTHNGGFHNPANVKIAHRIVVLFDQAVIVHNYEVNNYSLVSIKDLDGKKPTGVEFLDDYNCAIGCSDGMIRIWNIPQARVVKCFGNSKAEVACLKVIPFEKSPVSDIGEGKIRILAVGSDGVALIWLVHILPNGDFSNDPVDSPIAKLHENLGPKASNKTISFDRESQILLTCAKEQRVYIWSLQDLNSASLERRRSNVRRSVNANRRLSVMGGRFLGTNNLTASGEDGEDIFSMNIHGILKLEKAILSIYPKISTFCALKHPYFISGIYAIASKTASIAFVQNKNTGNVGDESEKSSTVAGGAMEKQRLEILFDISVEKLLMDYAKRSQQSLQFTEPLKVYHIQSVITRRDKLIVATSYGPIILSFPFLPNTGFVGVHPKWSEMKLIHTDAQSVKAILPNPVPNTSSMSRRASLQAASTSSHNHSNSSYPGDASVSFLPVNEEMGMDVVGEIAGSLTSEDRLHSLVANRSAPADRRSLIITASGGGSGGQSRASIKGMNATTLSLLTASPSSRSSRSLFYPSPSGTFCTLYYPDICLYAIYAVLSTGSQHCDFQEVEKGYALSFAWLDHQDYYLVKTCKALKTIQSDNKPNKRASFTGLFTRTEKPKFAYKESELILKRCVRNDDINDKDPSAPPMKSYSFHTEEMLCDELLWQVPGKAVESIALSSINVLQLFSGPIVGISYSYEPSKEIPLPAGILEEKQMDTHRYESILAYETWYTRFYALTLPSSSASSAGAYGTDAMKCALVPISPILPPIRSVHWDYFPSLVEVDGSSGESSDRGGSGHHVCVLFLSGSMSIMSLVHVGNQRSLQVLQTLSPASFSWNPHHSLSVGTIGWWNGLLYLFQAQQWEVYAPAKLVVRKEETKTKTSTSTSLVILPTVVHHTSIQPNPLKLDKDWKALEELSGADFVGIHHGQLLFYTRDGVLKGTTLSFSSVASVLNLAHILEHEVENLEEGEQGMRELVKAFLHECVQSEQLTANDKSDIQRILCQKGLLNKLL